MLLKELAHLIKRYTEESFDVMQQVSAFKKKDKQHVSYTLADSIMRLCAGVT